MQKHYQNGFSLVEIMIAVSIISLLAAISIPNLVRSRESARVRLCIDNLRQLDDAKQQWALEHGKESATPEATEVQPYLGRAGVGSLPWCPADPTHSFAQSYVVNDLKTLPVCKTTPDTHFLPTTSP